MITEVLVLLVLFALLIKASIRPSNFPPGIFVNPAYTQYGNKQN
jgi:hypothetical protein